MRRLLATVVFGLVLLVAAPAAQASQASDYPPRTSGSGIFRRAPAPAPPPTSPPAPPPAAISRQRPQSDLVRTGGDAMRELGVGTGLVVLGGAILIVTRRRRVAVRG